MPTLTQVRPAAALPGGELELQGTDLGPAIAPGELAIKVEISGVDAPVLLSRPTRVVVRVPEGVLPGNLTVSRGDVRSNALPVAVGVPLAENLHPVANPVVDAAGSVYTTLSGARGQQTPVSVFRIGPAPEGIVHELRPFAREILNPSGLAFGQDGNLYVSSRAEGAVYRVSPAGEVRPFAEGLGVATGLAFDREGNLYVGDRSGTIFKIRRRTPGAPPDQAQETFVFATLEPSIAAYHLAFDSAGVLYVTGPTTASNQAIYAIDRDGTTRVFLRGLGRAQGLAFDTDDTLYVVASLAGERGVVRIRSGTPPALAVSAPSLVGLCLLPQGRMALATRDAVYEIGPAR